MQNFDFTYTSELSISVNFSLLSYKLRYNLKSLNLEESLELVLSYHS